MHSGDGPTKARPACSTLRANSAFSDKKPYLFRKLSETSDFEDHQ